MGVDQKFYWGDFFTGWRELEEEWFWQFEPFSKLKTTFCEYWTAIKIKINMTCVPKVYEIEKMEQKQWLQLKMLFLLGYNLKIVGGGGIKIWWGDFSISGEISKFSVGWGWLVYHNAAFEISWNDRVLLRSLLILAISGQSIKFWINFSWLEEFCLSQFTILIWYMSISIQLYVIRPLELQGWAKELHIQKHFSLNLGKKKL